MKTSVKLAILATALTSLTACDYFQNKEFRAERADKLYRAAMADYSAGRLDAAIDGFKKAVRANPGNASARFQLACLLQDKKQDYLGALCCYREYLLQTSGGDKEKMAKDRAALCEKLFVGELTKKMNLSDASGAAKGLADAHEATQRAEKRLALTSQKLTEAEAANKTLKEENARLRRMLSSVGEDAPAPKKMDLTEAKAILEDSEGDRLKLSPDAKKLFDEEEQEEARKIADNAKQAAKDLDDDKTSSLLTRKEGEEAYKGPKLTEMRDAAQSKPKAKKDESRPEFYVVQEGDTLYKIALRFYGRRDAWIKIHQANKATISSDARIRPGQKLKLP